MTDASAVDATAAPAEGETPARRFRADIDGLRAVAILLVVAYHADIPRFGGGFVGVDVFFVISGYLITRNLFSEADRTGGVALVQFWARRIRRLVPALALVIVATFLATMWVRPVLGWDEVAQQGRAAALYVSNLTFASASTDYFAADVRSSPFLHTWSLSVEEQFYVVWPLLAGAACLVAARRGRRRAWLVAAFALVGAVSLPLSLAQTSDGSVWAFYGLPSRAWEFAVAGLLAAVPARWLGWPRVARSAAAIGGLALIAFATVRFEETDPYPGVRAFVPVIGTLLLLASGDGSAEGGFRPLTWLFCIAPVQWLGRVSYSWYLWHWPAIVLAVDAFDRDTVELRTSAAVVALGLAAAAHHLVENPVRFHQGLARSPRPTIAMGVVVTGAVVASSFALAARSHADIESDDTLQTMEEVKAGARVFVCANLRTTPDGLEYCEDGDLAGDRTVMLIGDSHAAHLSPAFAGAAKAEGIRLLIRWRPRCPSLDVMVTKPGTSQHDPECDAFRVGTAELLAQLAPDAVVVSNTNGYHGAVLLPEPSIDPDARTKLWAAAYEEELAGLRAAGYRIGAVYDTPTLPWHAVDCVAESSIEECSVTLDEAQADQRDVMDAETRVERSLGDVPVLNLSPDLCPGGICPPVIDGVFVYADNDHLNSEFARTLVPQVREFLGELVGTPSG